MKQFIFLCFALVLFSCAKEDAPQQETTNQPELVQEKSQNISLVEKRIIQETDISGMGMLKNIQVDSLQKLNETTFVCRVSFFNPVIDNDVRFTKIYSFTNDLDSILTEETAISEMKSMGEWVKMNF